MRTLLILVLLLAGCNKDFEVSMLVAEDHHVTLCTNAVISGVDTSEWEVGDILVIEPRGKARKATEDEMATICVLTKGKRGSIFWCRCKHHQLEREAGLHNEKVNASHQPSHDRTETPENID